MYRIVFDPKISRFVVQIMVWHLFWRDCHREIAGPGTPVRERITFVELAAEPGFQDAFADAMLFPEFEVA